MLLAYRRRAPALRGSRASHLRHRWTRRRGRRVGPAWGGDAGGNASVLGVMVASSLW